MATSETMRAVVFTEHKQPPEWDKVERKLAYMAYAQETCPTTNKVHYQGFAYANTAMRLSGWKKLLPTAKIEKMSGNFMHNEKYRSTEGELMEFGERPVQGKRNDIAQLKAKLDAGQSHVSRSIGPCYLVEIAPHACTILNKLLLLLDHARRTYE